MHSILKQILVGVVWGVVIFFTSLALIIGMLSGLMAMVEAILI